MNKDTLLAPRGELSLCLPADASSTNVFGDVFGGWVSSRVVMAAELCAASVAKGRVATVSAGAMEFMSPVTVGTVLSFYTRVEEMGRSSLRVGVEVWGANPDGSEVRKVTETECVQVAIDGHGHIRSILFGEE